MELTDDIHVLDELEVGGHLLQLLEEQLSTQRLRENTRQLATINGEVLSLLGLRICERISPRVSRNSAAWLVVYKLTASLVHSVEVPSEPRAIRCVDSNTETLCTRVHVGDREWRADR